jgi:hypothetical protein
MFKKLAVVLVLAMVFSVAASAQLTDVYWTTYFSNNGIGCQRLVIIYIINPGVQGAPIDPTDWSVLSCGLSVRQHLCVRQGPGNGGMLLVPDLA